jgi:dTMP kinase
MESRGGRFITFEGGEGTGKSTQARLLATHLRRLGRETLLTREPGGAPLSERLRSLLLEGELAVDPVAELLLYEAARRQHVAEVIVPALERGAVVLCDRFADATVAYQGHGRGLDIPIIERLNELACGDCRPSITFLLAFDDSREGLERARKRHGTGGDRFEREELAFHERVRTGYLALASAEPGRFAVIDARGTPGTVRRRILAAYRERTGEAG